VLKKSAKIFLIVVAACLAHRASAQTTNGLITGVITDSSGAAVPGARVVVKERRGMLRTATSVGNGYYIVPQLPPGTYDISVTKQGFAVVNRANVSLQVNQNATLDFKLTVSSVSQTIQVTGAPPPLNTTSATIGTVIGHSSVVDLPLNGRQFTQLTLLTPGAAPIEAKQQSKNIISLGAGGISPSVNGQRPRANNFTMDGVLNNEIHKNVWAITPPPDAIQEFNVQSHITDAQFSIGSGANINVVTRSGTNNFHGSLWEFFRNDVLDAQQYPDTQRNPYRQNQYGVYFGGPVMLPRWHRKKSTWFSGYWEGFRSANALSQLASTLTPAMMKGDFSALLGPKVGTDDLGRPEYANEIYDPTTSRKDPKNAKAVIRDPFPGNKIPPSEINPDATLILQKYYPAPNLNVPDQVLPNFTFVGVTAKASDVAGIRIDHQFNDNNTIFGRFNRNNITESNPESLPGYVNTSNNYSDQYAIGYTHIIGAATVLNLRYGYLHTDDLTYDTPAGIDFLTALNLERWSPPQGGIAMGPGINLSNGYDGISQSNGHSGPIKTSDYHADLSKVMGGNTLSAGGMVYHINNSSRSINSPITFSQNATSVSGTAGLTGMGPASFLLGLPHNYKLLAGNGSLVVTYNWYGGYVQDLWQATKKLAVTAGLRYDYVAPPSFDKTVSGVNINNGQFLITQPSTPFSSLYPVAVGSSHLFYPQYNGIQPRLGIAYQASSRTVLRGNLSVMDDFSTTIQLVTTTRNSWPTAVQTTVTLLNQGAPTTYVNNLPPNTTFLNPNAVNVSYGYDPHSRIPHVIEYNAGIEQQLVNSMVLDLDYVGSGGHNLAINAQGNTAMIPGPGSLASRGQPYPQYEHVFEFDTNSSPSSYNALQAKLVKSLSSGLFFLASYTWSKSMDIVSDSAGNYPENIYNLHADWGPSDFDIRQMLVLSGVYELPIGRGKTLLSRPNSVVQTIAGDWNVGSIISLRSGQAFDVAASGDVANVGGGIQRANKIGNPYSGSGFHQSHNEWINPAAFANPAEYTFGNESRNDLTGPTYKNVDFSAYKNFSLPRDTTLQFRAELFNIFNHTNYGMPAATVLSSNFGVINSAFAPREVQFALKMQF